MRLLPFFVLVSCAPKLPGTAPRPVETLEYRIQWGDTLETIAARYAVGGGWPTLHAMNELWSPHWIYAGDVIRIPATREARAELGRSPAVTEPPVLQAAPFPVLESPRLASVDGCLKAACVALEPGAHACACERGRGDDLMLVQRAGLAPLTWSANIPGTPDDSFWDEGGLTDFTVARADLDGDGDTEFLVARRVLTDDLARSTWEVALVEDAAQDTQPLRFTAGNVGAGTLVSTAGGSPQLLLTSWELHRPEGLAQERWYFVGRSFTYEEAGLEPTGAPVLRRRLTYDFAPGALTQGLGTPLADLGVRTEAVDGEPITAGRREVMAIRIEASAPTPDGPMLTVESDDGSAQWRRADSTGHGAYDRLGDRRTGRLYPPGYDPGDLAGRTATAVRYDGRRVVWL